MGSDSRYSTATSGGSGFEYTPRQGRRERAWCRGKQRTIKHSEGMYPNLIELLSPNYTKDHGRGVEEGEEEVEEEVVEVVEMCLLASSQPDRGQGTD